MDRRLADRAYASRERRIWRVRERTRTGRSVSLDTVLDGQYDPCVIATVYTASR
jgi:hypothetical protein